MPCSESFFRDFLFQTMMEETQLVVFVPMKLSSLILRAKLRCGCISYYVSLTTIELVDVRYLLETYLKLSSIYLFDLGQFSRSKPRMPACIKPSNGGSIHVRGNENAETELL
jgi:hypothetical protein